MKPIEKKTRQIFHKIHVEQAKDELTFKRLVELLSPKYLKVPDNFFFGKICLDAGCGSNANATYSMLNAGAAKVYAFDLDKSIFKTVPKMLKGFEKRYELAVGNVLKINFPDNFFDFTHCSGVLHHTTDAFKGIRELARVTKKGGMLYIYIHGQGGLMREVVNFLRDKYKKDKNYKRLIDNIDEKFFWELWDWMVSEMAKHGDKLGESIPKDVMRQLLNKDLALSVKDRFTAPISHDFTEKELRELLKGEGFIKIERLTRYPNNANIRRFLSPFYNRYDHKFSRIFYGEGNIQLKAIKKS